MNHQILSDPVRMALERAVTERLGREWRAWEMTDLKDYACHPAAILSDGAYAVFAKFSDAANGGEQFAIELDGLRLLSQRAGVLTPTPVANLAVEGGALLVLEAVAAVERGPQQWREIGQALARIHQVRGERCGLETQGYFGALYQDNRPLDDWAAFFAERRLWPRFIAAVDSGRLDSPAIRQIERLIARVPELMGAARPICLLHGDAQQNNYISTAQGAVVIDPAACYGDAEFDLAFVDYFQPVPEEVFAAYREVLPIDPGFAERRDLYRVYGYLAAVSVEGGEGYMGQLMAAAWKYL